ncbi:unnamed protein product, partial [Iphiclides podalirius]
MDESPLRLTQSYSSSTMDYISGWCKSKRLLEGHTIIVTGANSGIGKYTALDLFQRGATVIMACRNTTKAEEAKIEIENMAVNAKVRGKLIIEKLDLSSLKSVRGFCLRMLESETRIDVLINNAGVMWCPNGRTEDGFETHIGTNHFGHALLTLLLLPRLIKSTPARVVTVASMANIVYSLDLDDINVEKTGYGGFKAYSKSKCANILFSRALHLKLQEHGINGVTTYSLHPGIVGTELGRHLDSSIISGATWVFNNVLKLMIKSSRCGAQTNIYCAVDEGCANESGHYYSECSKSIVLSKQCKNDDYALKLWDLTIEKLKLQGYDPFNTMSLDRKYLQVE